MDTETIVILAGLILTFILPILILKIISGSFSLTNLFKRRCERPPKEYEESKKISLIYAPLSSTSTQARVLEEICRTLGSFKIGRLGIRSGLSEGEIIILTRKADPFHTRAFPIREDASQHELNRWLDNPLMTRTLETTFFIDMASHIPVPVKMMEKMLKKLLGKSYQDYYQKAKEELKRKEHLT